ncbi:sugar phosphate isomerase/epimerase family protein [Adhaeribacter radiodurans]|uniref:Sugar phosphate isomerase/epimerase n=1 Tax=Adhaeribacter radiodurans TaxID=2745197 RepID=A0A7L7L8I1_9BACT|nr:sugar phosphate isomerase/epimerase [Adhaeribacter radiodurans]QMU29127.1 sugar phosphate isomerase/epimerase [Adhaeribacter radiodurans]
MQNRRNFLRASGALMLGGLGTLMLPGCNTKDAKTTSETASADSTATAASNQTSTATNLAAPGLQLYTVRELLEKDLKGTLQKIADIGYKNMESAAGSKGHYYGMKPKEFASMLEGMGMQLRSSHVQVGYNTGGKKPEHETLTYDLQKLVDMAAESGQKYLTCAYLAPNERRNLDDYKSHIALFNKAGEACKKAGLQFAYHNHDFEFETVDGQRPYDLMLAQTDKDLVKMELDLYWATKSGNDPIGLFEKNPGRFPLWHVKDMDKTEKKFFTEVGNGSIDFKRIFDAANTSGMEYYFVEQDVTPGNPLDSITTSYKNLGKVVTV